MLVTNSLTVCSCHKKEKLEEELTVKQLEVEKVTMEEEAAHLRAEEEEAKAS